MKKLRFTDSQIPSSGGRLRTLQPKSKPQPKEPLSAHRMAHSSRRKQKAACGFLRKPLYFMVGAT